MPKISISIPDYTYWKLTGEEETPSTLIIKALHEYWEKHPVTKTVLKQEEQLTIE